MSNQLRKFRKPEIEKRKMPNLRDLKNMGSQKIQINFKERVLPRTILVDVNAGDAFIGEENKPIGSCKKLHSGTTVASNTAFIEALEAIGEENIDKVILDNGDGFKHLSLSEFTISLRNYLAGMNTPKPDDKLFFINDYLFISNICIVDDFIFAIARKEIYDDVLPNSVFDVVIKFDKEFNIIKVVGKEFDAFFKSIILHPSGNLILSINIANDIKLVTFDKDLNVLYQKDIEMMVSNVITAIRCIDDGLYITGHHLSGKNNPNFIIRFSDHTFEDEYRVIRSCFSKEMMINDIVKKDDGFLVTALLNNDNREFEALFIKLDKNLDIVSTKAIDTDKSVYCLKLHQIDNDLYFCGTIGDDDTVTEPIVGKITDCDVDIVILKDMEKRLPYLNTIDHIGSQIVLSCNFFDSNAFEHSADLVLVNKDLIPEKVVKLVGVDTLYVSSIIPYKDQMMIAYHATTPFVITTTNLSSTYQAKDGMVQFEMDRSVNFITASFGYKESSKIL